MEICNLLYGLKEKEISDMTVDFIMARVSFADQITYKYRVWITPINRDTQSQTGEMECDWLHDTAIKYCHEWMINRYFIETVESGSERRVNKKTLKKILKDTYELARMFSHKNSFMATIFKRLRNSNISLIIEDNFKFADSIVIPADLKFMEDIINQDTSATYGAVVWSGLLNSSFFEFLPDLAKIRITELDVLSRMQDLDLHL